MIATQKDIEAFLATSTEDRGQRDEDGLRLFNRLVTILLRYADASVDTLFGLENGNYDGSMDLRHGIITSFHAGNMLTRNPLRKRP